jgi:hypothetical protein
MVSRSEPYRIGASRLTNAPAIRGVVVVVEFGLE